MKICSSFYNEITFYCRWRLHRLFYSTRRWRQPEGDITWQTNGSTTGETNGNSVWQSYGTTAGHTKTELKRHEQIAGQTRRQYQTGKYCWTRPTGWAEDLVAWIKLRLDEIVLERFTDTFFDRITEHCWTNYTTFTHTISFSLSLTLSFSHTLASSAGRWSTRTEWRTS